MKNIETGDTITEEIIELLKKMDSKKRKDVFGFILKLKYDEITAGRSVKITPSMYDSKSEFGMVDVSILKDGELLDHYNCVSLEEAERMADNHKRGIK